MAQIPHADPGVNCPLYQKDMSEVCHKCAWWTKIVGKNPQSEEMIDDWRCAVALLPMLLIENAQMSRQTGAAVETMRNGMVKGVVESVFQAIGGAAEQQRRLNDAREHPSRR
jgi:hypothetical protein